MKSVTCLLFVVVILFTISNASATLLEFTYTSSSAGVLGSFVMDDIIFDGSSNQSVENSYVVDLSFSYSGSTYDIDDLVPTGTTKFDSSGLLPTVVGGAGYFATNVWFDGPNTLWIEPNTFDDGAWSTSGYGAPVPEPATVLLLGTGLVGLAGFRKKFKK